MLNLCLFCAPRLDIDGQTDPKMFRGIRQGRKSVGPSNTWQQQLVKPTCNTVWYYNDYIGRAPCTCQYSLSTNATCKGTPWYSNTCKHPSTTSSAEDWWQQGGEDECEALEEGPEFNEEKQNEKEEAEWEGRISWNSIKVTKNWYRYFVTQCYFVSKSKKW